MAFALIELPSLDILNAVHVGAMPELSAKYLDDGWNSDWVTRRYYYVRLNDGGLVERLPIGFGRD